MSDEACAADSAERQRLRARHGVRLVKTEEEGQDIALLPNGVAGFTAAPGAGEMPVFAAPIYLATEVHKSAEGTIYLIGYLTAAEAAVLEAGAEPLQVNLYPEPYEEAQTLVAVPLERIDRRRLPLRDKGNPTPVEIAPRSQPAARR